MLASSERYKLNRNDQRLSKSASDLLRKIVAAGLTRPAQMVSVAKMQYVLSRLPQVTKNVTITISLISPRRRFEEIETWHWWDVCAAPGEVSIASGGHFYRSITGGDSFTTMNWVALPGEDSQFDDYLDSLGIVPDVQSFPDAVLYIDLAAETYILDVVDADNPFLSDEVEEDRD